MLNSKSNQITRESYDNAILVGRYKAAIRVRTDLSVEAHEKLTDMYAPILIMPGTDTPPPGMHQIGAAHLSVADHMINKYVRHLDSFLEIGPNAVGFTKRSLGKRNTHGCTLRSARDQQRHFTAAASAGLRGLVPDRFQAIGVNKGGLRLDQLSADVQALASGVPTETFCLNGWENCDHQAVHAVAVHSLYDIPLDKLAEGMRNHGTRTIRAYMHFPVEALVARSWTSSDKGYAYDTVEINGEDHIRFRWIDDPAFGYVHNRRHWLDYLLVGGLDTPFGFSLLIERTKQWGSQFELTITRTTAGYRPFFAIPSVMQDLTFVPNYRKMAGTGFCKRKFKGPKENPDYYILVDQRKFRKLFDYSAARVEKAFTFSNVRGYARTCTNEIRLNGTIRERSWDISTEEMNDVCLSVYIMILYQHRLNTAIISEAIEHMNQLGEEVSFVRKAFRWIRDKTGFTEVDHDKSSHGGRDVQISAQDSVNLFHRVTVRAIETTLVMDRVEDHFHNEHIYFPFNYDTEKPVEREMTREDIQAEALYAAQNPTDAGGWAADFNLPVNMPAAVGADYMSQDQHRILITELEGALGRIGSDGCRDNNAHALAITMKHALAALKKKTPEKFHVENLMALTGVPGGAKTGRVRQEIIPRALTSGKVLVLCPTRALADAYSQDLPAGSVAKTIHQGLNELQKNSWALVVIEEAFTLPMGYINFVASYGRTLLVGDPRQINHVDFSGGLWNGCAKLEAYLRFIPRHHINVTRRCPQDVTVLPVIRKHYPGITSESRVNSSISYVHERFENANAQVVCFTQEQKRQIQLLGKINAVTVHECQGRTYSSVILHYAGTAGERALIRQSPNHVIVGLTRHTNQLFVRDCTGAEGGDLVTAINDSSPLDVLADCSNIDLAAVENPTLTPKTHVELAVPLDVPYVCAKADHIAAEAVISKYYPAPPQREQVSADSVEYNTGADAKGVFKPHLLSDDTDTERKRHTVYCFDGPQRVKITKHSNDQMHARSMLERLTHSTKNMAPNVARKLAKELFRKVEAEFDWNLPENAHHRMFLDALEKMTRRGQNMDSIMDAPDWRERYVALVKSFLKDQQKPMLGKDPLETDKAGQGISAWDKTLNLLMSPWTRLLEQVLMKQSFGKIRVMSGMSDLEVQAIIEADVTPGERFVDNDWTQFDSNQNNLTREILLRALRRIGTPEVLLSRFEEQIKTRKVCFTALSLEVNDKKDSGAPHTLVDNCLFNLAICMDVIENYEHLYIKGDDSLARGPAVGFNKERMDYYTDKCGFQFKPGSSGQFVSFIVTEHGVAFDMPRLAAKVLSRCYTSETDFKNYQEAIGATFKNVDQDAGYNMCRVNAIHYDHSTRTDHHFDLLLSFLLSFARGEVPFSTLIQKERFQVRVSGPARPTYVAIGSIRPSARKSFRKRVQGALTALV